MLSFLKRCTPTTNLEAFLLIAVGFVLGRGFFGSPWLIGIPILFGVPALIARWRHYCDLDND